MRNWLIAGGVVVLLIGIITAWALLTPSPNAGDRTKLDVQFTPAEIATLDARTVTGQELTAATCDDGQQCWVAVNGVVYDMSVFPKWARGRHHGVDAGTDATQRFVGSGHARAILEKMPVVGRLAS